MSEVLCEIIIVVRSAARPLRVLIRSCLFDAFSGVVIGSLLQGDSLPIAFDRAVQFTSIAIRATFGHRYPVRDDVLLERVLDNLKGPVAISSYELLE